MKKRNKYEAIPTARFWVWWNNGWVKISLKERPRCRFCSGWLNQTNTSRGFQKAECIKCEREQQAQFNDRLTLHKSWDNGEGCSWEAMSFEYVSYRVFPHILEEYGGGGSDCDGKTSTRGSCAAAMDSLASVPSFDDGTMSGYFNGRRIMRPRWIKLGRERCYDQFAEAAGY